MTPTPQNKTALRLRRCREDAHETLDQIAALVGVNKSTVLRWESGQTTKINRPTLERLAQHFGVECAWLSGEDVPCRRTRDWLSDHALSMDELIDLPVWGRPLLLRQRADDDALPLPWDSDCLWIRVIGDSMAPLMSEGDLLLVRPQTSVGSGQYAVLLLDDEPLLRQVTCGEDFLELHCENPYYPPLRLENEQMLRVRILGLILESKRSFV